MPLTKVEFLRRVIELSTETLSMIEAHGAKESDNEQQQQQQQQHDTEPCDDDESDSESDHSSDEEKIERMLGMSRAGRAKHDVKTRCILNAVYAQQTHLNDNERATLAKRTGLTSRQVTTYFQNKRSRDAKRPTLRKAKVEQRASAGSEPSVPPASPLPTPVLLPQDQQRAEDHASPSPSPSPFTLPGFPTKEEIQFHDEEDAAVKEIQQCVAAQSPSSPDSHPANSFRPESLSWSEFLGHSPLPPASPTPPLVSFQAPSPSAFLRDSFPLPTTSRRLEVRFNDDERFHAAVQVPQRTVTTQSPPTSRMYACNLSSPDNPSWSDYLAHSPPPISSPAPSPSAFPRGSLPIPIIPRRPEVRLNDDGRFHAAVQERQPSTPQMYACNSFVEDDLHWSDSLPHSP